MPAPKHPPRWNSMGTKGALFWPLGPPRTRWVTGCLQKQTKDPSGAGGNLPASKTKAPLMPGAEKTQRPQGNKLGPGTGKPTGGICRGWIKRPNTPTTTIKMGFMVPHSFHSNSFLLPLRLVSPFAPGPMASKRCERLSHLDFEDPSRLDPQVGHGRAPWLCASPPSPPSLYVSPNRRNLSLSHSHSPNPETNDRKKVWPFDLSFPHGLTCVPQKDI